MKPGLSTIALNDALPEPMRLISELPSHYADTNVVLSDKKIYLTN